MLSIIGVLYCIRLHGDGLVGARLSRFSLQDIRLLAPVILIALIFHRLHNKVFLAIVNTCRTYIRSDSVLTVDCVMLY